MQSVYLNGLTSLCSPPTPVVMGVRLRPFSLGHSVLLEAVESPYMSDAQSVDSGDLALAVWICSHTYEDASAALNSDDPRIKKAFMRWGKRWSRRGVFLDELDTFTAYLNYYADAPTRWESDDSNELRVPWQWAMLNTLCGGVADPALHSRVLNMPLNSAICQACAIGAANGDESLMSEYEERAISELAEISRGAGDV